MMVTIREISQNPPQWAAYLRDRATHSDKYTDVMQALEATDVPTLDQQRETVVALMGALDKDSRVALLVGVSKERVTFLAECMSEAKSR